MACCHDDHCAAPDKGLNSPHWRRALWIALAVNAGFFLAEIVAGVAAGSSALQADALDFFGDAANYAISLGVAGMALGGARPRRAAQGRHADRLALWVLGSTAWHALHGTLPQAEVMGVVGVAALLANARRGADALPLPRRRREHALGVDLLAQRRDRQRRRDAGRAGVFGTGTGWPDVIVAAIMGGARPLGRLADRPPGRGRAQHAVGATTCRIGFPAMRAALPGGVLLLWRCMSCTRRPFPLRRVIPQPERMTFASAPRAIPLSLASIGTGPSLAGVLGRRSGTAERVPPLFARPSSSGCDLERNGARCLDLQPAGLCPGQRDEVQGDAGPEMRADLIAYLAQAGQGGAPMPRGGMMNMGAGEAPDLKTLGPHHQVTAIRHCEDTYEVTTADGTTEPFGRSICTSRPTAANAAPNLASR